MKVVSKHKSYKKKKESKWIQVPNLLFIRFRAWTPKEERRQMQVKSMILKDTLVFPKL